MIAAIYPDEPMTWRGWGSTKATTPQLGCGSSKSRRAGSAFLEADEEETLLAAADEPLRMMMLGGIYGVTRISYRRTKLTPSSGLPRISQRYSQ
jgi:hypothetical protein